jgi:hypothetical protein
MSLAFVDRPPTPEEFEQFRLILSTYQDGSGMLAISADNTWPGWRDFERTVAAAFGGVAQEDKSIFDVLVPDADGKTQCGISCKMRGELNRLEKDGRVTIELSNSIKKFQDYLASKGIKPEKYATRASQVGAALIELVEQWKREASIEQGGRVNLTKSCYLTLMYNRAGLYQLHWFHLALPDPAKLHWYYPKVKKDGKLQIAGHLNGDDGNGGRVFEWYSRSGGQLKYYPLAKDALWASEQFRLEPIPPDRSTIDLAVKAKMYFPELWAKSAGA